MLALMGNSDAILFEQDTMRDRLLQEARTLDDAELVFVIDYVFVLICGFLCFLLQAGFGLLEVGGESKQRRGRAPRSMCCVYTCVTHILFLIRRTSQECKEYHD